MPCCNAHLVKLRRTAKVIQKWKTVGGCSLAKTLCRVTGVALNSGRLDWECEGKKEHVIPAADVWGDPQCAAAVSRRRSGGAEEGGGSEDRPAGSGAGVGAGGLLHGTGVASFEVGAWRRGWVAGLRFGAGPTVGQVQVLSVRVVERVRGCGKGEGQEWGIERAEGAGRARPVSFGG